VTYFAAQHDKDQDGLLGSPLSPLSRAAARTAASNIAKQVHAAAHKDVAAVSGVVRGLPKFKSFKTKGASAHSIHSAKSALSPLLLENSIASLPPQVHNTPTITARLRCACRSRPCCSLHRD